MKSKILIVTITFLPFVLSIATAQTGPDDPSHADITALQRTGNMVAVRLVPDKKLKIFVVGKEQAELDLKRFKLFVRELSPHPRELTLNESDGYYTVNEPLEPGKPAELEVKTVNSGKSETFHFKINIKKD